MITQEQRRTIVEGAGHGMPWGMIAALAGISIRTLYRWLDADAQLLAEAKAAQAELEARLEARLEPGLPKRREPVTVVFRRPPMDPCH